MFVWEYFTGSETVPPELYKYWNLTNYFMQLYGSKVMSVVSLAIEVRLNGISAFDVLRVVCFAG